MSRYAEQLHKTCSVVVTIYYVNILILLPKMYSSQNLCH